MNRDLKTVMAVAAFALAAGNVIARTVDPTRGTQPQENIPIPEVETWLSKAVFVPASYHFVRSSVTECWNNIENP